MVYRFYEMPKIEKMLNVLEENVLPQHLPQLGIVVRAYGTYLTPSMIYVLLITNQMHVPSTIYS